VGGKGKEVPKEKKSIRYDSKKKKKGREVKGGTGVKVAEVEVEEEAG
jgi:hypothetical protein